MTDTATPPKPDLHEFIRRFDGYAAVTVEGWAEWDRLSAEWRQNRRDQLHRELEISKRRARSTKVAS
jgi:hypothetical protein